MTLKAWTTNYPTSLDTTTEQPVLTNYTDRIDATHVNSMGTALRALEGQVGSDLLESSALITTVNNMKQRSVKLTWSSVTLINITAWPGEDSTVPIRLQDGVWRSFTGTLTFNPSAVGEGGLDAGVEADTWYSLYLVPTAADDSLLCVRGSTTTPVTGGPTGYTNYRYIGVVRNASLNLLRFNQLDHTHFHWNLPGLELWENFVSDANPVQRTLNYVPTVASAAVLEISLQGEAGGAFYYRIYVDAGVAPVDGDNTACMIAFGDGDARRQTTCVGLVPLVTPRSIYYQKKLWGGSIRASYIKTSAYIDGYLT